MSVKKALGDLDVMFQSEKQLFTSTMDIWETGITMEDMQLSVIQYVSEAVKVHQRRIVIGVMIMRISTKDTVGAKMNSMGMTAVRNFPIE